MDRLKAALFHRFFTYGFEWGSGQDQGQSSVAVRQCGSWVGMGLVTGPFW